MEGTNKMDYLTEQDLATQYSESIFVTRPSEKIQMPVPPNQQVQGELNLEMPIKFASNYNKIGWSAFVLAIKHRVIPWRPLLAILIGNICIMFPIWWMCVEPKHWKIWGGTQYYAIFATLLGLLLAFRINNGKFYMRFFVFFMCDNTELKTILTVLFLSLNIG